MLSVLLLFVLSTSGGASESRQGPPGAGVRAQLGEQRRVPAVRDPVRLRRGRKLQGAPVHGRCVLMLVCVVSVWRVYVGLGSLHEGSTD